MILSKEINSLKGIHPGVFIHRQLQKLKLSQRKLALDIQVHHQTLNAIIKSKRALNLKMAIKIENYFQLEEGTLMLLQLFYDIAMERQKKREIPNISLFRSVLFWDTDMQKIDWQKNKKAVIQRIISRGNKEEVNEIKRFYGKQEVNAILNSFKWAINA